MAVCAKAVQQGDGSFALVLDPTVTDLSTCAYVVQSGAELQNSLFFMTAEDGAYYSASIVTVWIAAWCARQLINMFSNEGKSHEK